VPFLLPRSSSVASPPSDQDPRMMPRDARRVDPDRRVRSAPDKVGTFGERNVPEIQTSQYFAALGVSNAVMGGSST
jgi:hypothetical protein